MQPSLLAESFLKRELTELLATVAETATVAAELIGVVSPEELPLAVTSLLDTTMASALLANVWELTGAQHLYSISNIGCQIKVELE